MAKHKEKLVTCRELILDLWNDAANLREKQGGVEARESYEFTRIVLQEVTKNGWEGSV